MTVSRRHNRRETPQPRGSWLALPSILIALFGGAILGAGCKPKASGLPGSGDLLVLEIEGRKLEVEVVTDSLGRQNGLMFRRKLPESSAMLFVYPQPEKLSFWMRNTYIPLSIAFLDDEGKILQIEDMRPKDESRTTSKYRVRYALEVNQGWFQRNGIRVGGIISDFKERVRPFHAR